jgi:uncharacterized protein (TIGR00369 family)
MQQFLRESGKHPSRLDFFKSLVGKSTSETPSPLGTWLNGRIEAVEAGSITASFEVRKEMTNPFGGLHGGVISAIMDELIGATVHSLDLPRNYSNLNFQVDFLAPANLGDRITAKTTIIRSGKKIINAACEIFSENEKLLARGSSNLVQVSIEMVKKG